jgi:SAM-dependent methyltransferase
MPRQECPRKPKSIIESHYEPRLEHFREGYQILDWENHEAQFIRFRVLTEKVDLTERSILDVGCGVGELYGYLLEKGIRCRYTGIDILPGMIREASERYPSGKFLQGDVIEEGPFPDGSFDVVFCSGIFNLCMGDNYEYLSRAVDSFLTLADHFVLFNLLSCDSPDKADKYFYYVPDRVIGLLESKVHRLEVVTGYLPNDFTIVCELA